MLLSTRLNGRFVPAATVGRWGEGPGGQQHPVIMFLNRGRERGGGRVNLMDACTVLTVMFSVNISVSNCREEDVL